MTVVLRYAVRVGQKYVTHRRYSYKRGSHEGLGPPANARVWSRKADAEWAATEHGGKVETVRLTFGPPTE